MKRKTPVFVYILFLFALLGFGTLLMTNPGVLVRYFVGTMIVIAILLLVFKFFSPSNIVRTEEDRAFAKAAKYSKKRLKKKLTSKKKSPRSKQALRKHPKHLTVIEGKKGKKKSRALH